MVDTMNSKHTPGPWTNTGLELQIRPYPGLEIWGNPDENRKYTSFVALALRHNSLGREQEVANAHLIAAAPDLLAACESMCDWLEDHGRITNKMFGVEDPDLWRLGVGVLLLEQYDILAAAIARAKGDE